MKAISIGTRYEIYNDSLKAYDRLPAKTYTVRFAQMSGFFLEERTDLSVNEKVYGVHPEKADKVLKAFTTFERNLGVILSGDKGIGKSLFARLLSAKAVEAGYPVIIIDQFIPGIASYIESIDQEAVFLFDEFDKTFGSIRQGDNEADPQSRLLSLFDGTSQGKKLFIITCNSLHRLNDYLVNRPGRFHYHFRFDYPSGEEILKYMTDKLGAQYHGEIEKVILFSKKVSLNFDCLRAIAFELSLGEPFEKIIQDLNIINVNAEDYDLALHCKGGTILTAKGQSLDLFNKGRRVYVYLEDDKSGNGIQAAFDPADCVYDPAYNTLSLPGDRISLISDADGETPFDCGGKEFVKKLAPEYMTISRAASRNIHYLTA